MGIVPEYQQLVPISSTLLFVFIFSVLVHSFTALAPTPTYLWRNEAPVFRDRIPDFVYATPVLSHLLDVRLGYSA